MTTSKVFKKCAIALTVSTLLTAIPGIAQPASSLMADTPAKLQSQGGFETQFIIKYKENSEVTNFSNVDAHSLSIKKQVQNFVTNFTSKKSKIKARVC
ncbi:hypothetical protein [Pseudoalteromonas distincta]|uniref:hypothetical protein n=1 Tax=Pseudoalteromonas distincta TaxID=77608 RepID=UPI0032E0EFD4